MKVRPRRNTQGEVTRSTTRLHNINVHLVQKLTLKTVFKFQLQRSQENSFFVFVFVMVKCPTLQEHEVMHLHSKYHVILEIMSYI